MPPDSPSSTDGELDAISVTLSIREWISVGACMTHALEAGPEHPMADFWGEALAKLGAQVEASGA